MNVILYWLNRKMGGEGWQVESDTDIIKVGLKSMSVQYTDRNRVAKIRTTRFPENRSKSGYGSKIPSSGMVKYLGDDNIYRWYRVYCMVYSNSGTAYIVVNGKHLVLDTDTEHELNYG